MTGKHVLLISYYFPPFPGAGALRPGRLAKLLPAYGWIPTTIAGPAATTGAEYGDVLRITPLGDPVAARIRGLWRVLSPPGRWYPAALRTALELTGRRHFDAIVSIHNPGFDHMLAAAVAKRRGLPWLADYSEAWTGNGFLMPKSPLARHYNRLIELRSLRGAAAFTCATSGIRTTLENLHGRDGIEVIENALDAGEWDDVPSFPPRAFTFLYAGALYGGKLTPDPVFAAVAALRAAGHPAGAAARFVFYGSEHRVVAEAAHRWQIEDAVTLEPVTPRVAVLHAERRAAALIVLFPKRAMSVTPSKLYEYYGARRPVIAFGPPETKAHIGAIIEENRLGYFATTVEECATAICTLYARYLSGIYETDPSSEWSPPTALTTTRQFAGILDRIAGLPSCVPEPILKVDTSVR